MTRLLILRRFPTMLRPAFLLTLTLAFVLAADFSRVGNAAEPSSTKTESKPGAKPDEKPKAEPKKLPRTFKTGVIAVRGAVIETVGPGGRIENGTILIRDGVIDAVGTDVKIPLSARIIDVSGGTIMPAIVDPYFVVSIPGASVEPEFREIVFGGRVFRIPIAPSAAPTVFARVADGFDARLQRWKPAHRSGIGVAQLVSAGYGQSVFADLVTTDPERVVRDVDGRLFVAVTNQTPSLTVLRAGLEVPPDVEADPSKKSTSTSPGSSSSSSRGSSDPADAIWKKIRDGEQTLFLNANNASAILYVCRMLKAIQPEPETDDKSADSPDKDKDKDKDKKPSDKKTDTDGDSKDESSEETKSTDEKTKAEDAKKAETPKEDSKKVDEKVDEPKGVRVALVAGGDDIFLTLDSIGDDRVTLVLPPRIDLIPNSQNRVNVPSLLKTRGIPFAFSLSLGGSDYRGGVASPLFGVARLVRSGLPREDALAALTIVPAKLMGIDDEVGSIEVGKRAHLLFLDDDPFAGTTRVDQIMIHGRVIDDF